jgi:hypothetical protein
VNTNTNKKETFYKKEGRKYVPVYEYDQELMDAFPQGAHLVICYPGGKSTRYNVDPNYAAMIAAGRLAEDAVSNALVKATEIRRQKRSEQPLTPGQRDAWEKLVEEFGPDAKQLEWPSARECSEAAVKAMIDEAERLMQHESVRLAYEHFQMVCKLTMENKNDTGSI